MEIDDQFAKEHIHKWIAAWSYFSLLGEYIIP
jgi:hypothetical protein